MHFRRTWRSLLSTVPVAGVPGWRHGIEKPRRKLRQRLRLTNRDESATLRELLRWRQVQSEGQTSYKQRPPQSPPLPPTLLWTKRKASH
ncbi:hypothetical protein AMECASPLE_011013 [Ameca splendens]|uniref:Uncharacterized protein n=1 Tax=Ameca splendens TaxID=208324 RepID=A0ABV0YMZ4_9TELE